MYAVANANEAEKQGYLNDFGENLVFQNQAHASYLEQYSLYGMNPSFKMIDPLGRTLDCQA